MNTPTKIEIILKKLRQFDVTGYEQKVEMLLDSNNFEEALEKLRKKRMEM